MKQSGRRPARSISLARVAASRSRSTDSMTSNKATASRALLVCRGPIRCSSRSGYSAFSAGNFSFGLLHAVLAEHALAGGQQLAHAVGAVGLGDGDQGDGGRIAAGGLRRLGDAPADLRQAIGALAHASRLGTGRAEGLGVVGIGRQRRIQGLARLVLVAQRRQADAVVGEQPRIAGQAAQRVLVQRPRFGRPAEIDQHAAEIGQHQRIVGRQPRGALERPPRLVEALQAAQRQALVVERAHIVGRLP